MTVRPTFDLIASRPLHRWTSSCWLLFFNTTAHLVHFGAHDRQPLIPLGPGRSSAGCNAWSRQDLDLARRRTSPSCLEMKVQHLGFMLPTVRIVTQSCDLGARINKEVYLNMDLDFVLEAAQPMRLRKIAGTIKRKCTERFVPLPGFQIIDD
ncbi:hypothetical protein BKA70DRAFT_136161 [Coprinopsis sp. MPI-PUGE-AT-0042]|nr:hypothetical protein BKA70DRAFT_136161 [Coprinopsis sp. MPI-PUGE-AT-0042]